jgi:lysophospholipase L1-like esterase
MKITALLKKVMLMAVLGLSICASPLVYAQIRVACIGDSITAGYGLSNPGVDGYPAQLGVLLGSGYAVINYGVTSTTLMKGGDAPYWNTSAYTDSSNYLPNIVIIMLGTNDSKPNNWANKANFVPDYLSMISHYAGLSSKPVVYVATCPKVYGDNGSGQWGITDAVVTGEIVPLERQIASQAGSPLVDVNAATSGMSQNFPDFIHPNATGAAAIAQAVYAALTSQSPTTAPTAAPTTAPTSVPTGTKGDVNSNGSVDIVDALLVAQYYVGLNPAGFVSANADVNCSGTIDIVDALMIAQRYVGLISAFPC